MDGYESVPFTFPLTIVPAVSPDTEFESERPLFARVSAIRWYDQYYWPFALDIASIAATGGPTKTTPASAAAAASAVDSERKP